ncbi:MAG: ABC transporter permease [Solirubrobacteraceae bacterium]
MTALAHPAPDARPSLSRLTAVELRKMTDTRAGRWLLFVVALGAVAGLAGTLLSSHPTDHTMARFFTICGLAPAILLPVVGILAVTGEWTQRTALTTFALVPARRRVVAGKLLAGCALALAAVVVCLLLAATGNAIAGGRWNLDAARLAGGTAYMLISMLAGLALGLLLMQSAPAIVVYFVVPMAVGMFVEVIPSLRGPSQWFELGQATTPLGDGSMAAGDWPRLAVALAIWIGIPLAAGLLRLRRRELS